MFLSSDQLIDAPIVPAEQRQTESAATVPISLATNEAANSLGRNPEATRAGDGATPSPQVAGNQRHEVLRPDHAPSTGQSNSSERSDSQLKDIPPDDQRESPSAQLGLMALGEASTSESAAAVARDGSTVPNQQAAPEPTDQPIKPNNNSVSSQQLSTLLPAREGPGDGASQAAKATETTAVNTGATNVAIVEATPQTSAAGQQHALLKPHGLPSAAQPNLSDPVTPPGQELGQIQNGPSVSMPSSAAPTGTRGGVGNDVSAIGTPVVSEASNHQSDASGNLAQAKANLSHPPEEVKAVNEVRRGADAALHGEQNTTISTEAIVASSNDHIEGQHQFGLPELARFDISSLPRVVAGSADETAKAQPASSFSQIPGEQHAARTSDARTLMPQRAATSKLATRQPRKFGNGTGTSASSLNASALDRPDNGYKMVGGVIEFMLPIVAGGENLGKVTIHVGAEDAISMRLRDLLSLVSTKLDPQQLKAFNASPSVDQYVSFEQLRAAGIGVRYDAGNNRVVLLAD